MINVLVIEDGNEPAQTRKDIEELEDLIHWAIGTETSVRFKQRTIGEISLRVITGLQPNLIVFFNHENIDAVVAYTTFFRDSYRKTPILFYVSVDTPEELFSPVYCEGESDIIHMVPRGLKYDEAKKKIRTLLGLEPKTSSETS